MASRRLPRSGIRKRKRGLYPSTAADGGAAADAPLAAMQGLAHPFNDSTNTLPAGHPRKERRVDDPAARGVCEESSTTGTTGTSGRTVRRTTLTSGPPTALRPGAPSQPQDQGCQRRSCQQTTIPALWLARPGPSATSAPSEGTTQGSGGRSAKAAHSRRAAPATPVRPEATTKGRRREAVSTASKLATPPQNQRIAPSTPPPTPTDQPGRAAAAQQLRCTPEEHPGVRVSPASVPCDPVPLRDWVARGRPEPTGVPQHLAAHPSDASITELWTASLQREREYLADPSYMSRHQDIKPRMRAMVMDWLIEVCEEYLLQRETYYAAVNFMDRYLSATSGFPKAQMQLLGVTSLFVAAKMEEIHPPAVEQFADVTEDACSVDAILEFEVSVLQVLDWRLTPKTITSWLTLYLQILANPPAETFLAEQVFLHDDVHMGPHLFYTCSQLLDFATMDISSTRFSPSVLAATALQLFYRKTINVAAITGYSLEQLRPCYQWMHQYALVISKNLARYPSVADSEAQLQPKFTVQVKTNSLQLYFNVEAALRPTAVYLSPPASTSKPGSAAAHPKAPRVV